jgi:MFS family permease
MLADLNLDKISYAQINLWATLLGAPFCWPAGWLLDRCGMRWPAVVVLLLLAAVVLGMSVLAGGVMMLFLLVLLSRALGQSALSVASITTAGRAAPKDSGMAMGIYSVLLSVFFATAFVVVGGVVSNSGWRAAWQAVGGGVIVTAVLSFFLLPRKSVAAEQVKAADGLTLAQALRTPVFPVFGGGIALFGLVSSGVGLFNEAVLAERGFDANAYHTFLAVMAMTALAGQFLCGWLSRRKSLAKLLAVALFLYAASLAAVPLLRTQSQLWAFAIAFGFSGGMITVLFFAVWGRAFGPAHLGRIQGAAQTLAVFASALGPLLFAAAHDWWHSYTPLLLGLAPLVFAFGIAAWLLKMKPFTTDR